MKYRTTIQITTEAADKDEALEIVGDYLSGNLISGIEMKCRTAPSINYKIGVAAVTVFSFIIISGAVLAVHFNASQASDNRSSGLSAIQPPLRTSYSEDRNTDFKRDWQDTQSRRALESIKR